MSWADTPAERSSVAIVCRITFGTVSLGRSARVRNARHAVLKLAIGFPCQCTSGPLSTDNIQGRRKSQIGTTGRCFSSACALVDSASIGVVGCLRTHAIVRGSPLALPEFHKRAQGTYVHEGVSRHPITRLTPEAIAPGPWAVRLFLG